MKKISAEIVADSISPQGHRITSFILTYPRFIHSELMTHRLFSRNAASSRAIPFNKMVQMIEEDPFIPIAWQKDHKGMQGTKYITDKEEILSCRDVWLAAKDEAIGYAKTLNDSLEATKQLCNRLLEPFQWYTCLVTVTEYDNFFELRCPKYKLTGIGGESAKSRKDWIKHMAFSSFLHPSQYPKTEEEWWEFSESDAEIHIQALAEAMWDAKNESTPKQLNPGEWHIPFSDNINDDEILQKIAKKEEVSHLETAYDIYQYYAIKIATARCARLSYMTFEEKIDYEKDIKLHDQLLKSKHMSPFEHCARVMINQEYDDFHKGDLSKDNASQYGWCNNFKGFIQYRYLIENELPI